jgi:DNA-binding transcriptional LysR family regulator
MTMAARHLQTSPSAISHAMASLSRDLGCEILELKGKRPTLTSAGEQLLISAKKILNEMAIVRHSIDSRAAVPRLRLGSSADGSEIFLPEWIRTFHGSLPDAEITVASGSSAALLELVQRAEIDLAICVEPKHSGEFRLQRLFKDELQLVLPVNHPLFGKKKVAVSDLQSATFIISDQRSYTYALIEEFFENYHIIPGALIEVGSAQAVIESVRIGLGVSMLAPWTIREAIAGGSLCIRPLASGIVQRAWAIATSKAHPLTALQNLFINIAIAGAQSFIDNQLF